MQKSISLTTEGKWSYIKNTKHIDLEQSRCTFEMFKALENLDPHNEHMKTNALLTPKSVTIVQSVNET